MFVGIRNSQVRKVRDRKYWYVIRSVCSKRMDVYCIWHHVYIVVYTSHCVISVTCRWNILDAWCKVASYLNSRFKFSKFICKSEDSNFAGVVSNFMFSSVTLVTAFANFKHLVQKHSYLMLNFKLHSALHYLYLPWLDACAKQNNSCFVQSLKPLNIHCIELYIF